MLVASLVQPSQEDPFFKSTTLASFIFLIEPNVLNKLVLRLLPIPSTVSSTDCNPVFDVFGDGM